MDRLKKAEKNRLLLLDYGGGGNHSIISHARADRANAVTIMKTIIEPNRIAASLKNSAAFIFGIFVALYTIDIDATNGSSHSMDCGVTLIFSGIVKVATVIGN
ncbi:MAG: hypothetical protein ACYTFW_18055 [Planctomycetota bacterium]